MTCTIEKKKIDIRAAYIRARDEWNESRTPSNPNGDKALMVAFCDAKRLCRQFGVLI